MAVLALVSIFAIGAVAQESSWEVENSWEASPFELSALLLEIEGAMGHDMRVDVEKRLPEIEEKLQPKFVALGRNEHGNLAEAAVRYMLHRYFVQQRAWVVKGLDSGGEAWNASSPLELLRGQMSDAAVDVFRKRLQSTGFGLRDAAALAAMIEALVYRETAGTVRDIYDVLGFPVDHTVAPADVDTVLGTYVASLVMQVNISEIAGRLRRRKNPNDRAHLFAYVGSLRRELVEVWPAWTKTREFLRELREKSAPTGTFVHFSGVMTIVSQFLDRWGRWRYFECADIKRKLLDIEDEHSGCVRLADFYRSHTEKGVWQFAESAAFLRDQGILDEANPNDPHLIVPNYVNANGNCLASSKYYSVCCLNECENLLDFIGQHVRAPEAAPERIAAAVASLPVELPAARAIGHEEMQLLHAIGRSHGGVVPLHGRLFAQWMHRVFPRDCPYPHVSGRYWHEVIWEYEARKAAYGTVSLSEARESVGNLTQQTQTVEPGTKESTCMQWQAVEELVVPFRPPKTLAELEDDAEVWRSLGCLAMFTSTLAMGLVSWRTCRDTTRIMRRRGSPKKLTPAVLV